MNRGLHSFSQKPASFVRFIGFTTTISSPVQRPKGVMNGDMLIMGIGTRNATVSVSGGWGVLMTQDALSSEMNYLFAREADNEPSSYAYTVAGGGQTSVVLAAFRANRFLAVRDLAWRTSPESAPALLGRRGGLYIALACAALTGIHVSSFAGLKPVGGIGNANTNCFMAYLETPEDGTYGPYAASPTGASNDGYAGFTFG